MVCGCPGCMMLENSKPHPLRSQCRSSGTSTGRPLVNMTSCDPDIQQFHQKIGTPLTRAQENVHANFDFRTFFLFSTYQHAQNRQTGGQMDV